MNKATGDAGGRAPGQNRDSELDGKENPQQDPSLIRLGGPLEHDSIVNGDGLRAVVWTQGCLRPPEIGDQSAGVLVPFDEVKAALAAMRGKAGLTFCGGEPFLQAAACLELARWARGELGWNIWSFSGYTYEELLTGDPVKVALLRELDALMITSPANSFLPLVNSTEESRPSMRNTV